MINFPVIASLLLVTTLAAIPSLQKPDYQYAFVIPGLSLPSQYNWEMYPTLQSKNPSWIVDTFNIFKYPSYGKAVFFETRSSTIKKYTLKDGDTNSIKNSNSISGKILKQTQKQIYASQQVLKHFFSLFEFDGTSGKFGVIQCQGESRENMKCYFKNDSGSKDQILRTEQQFEQEKSERVLASLSSRNTEKNKENILSLDPFEKYIPDGLVRESAKFEKMSFLFENQTINIFQKKHYPIDMLILMLQFLLITWIAQALMKIIIKYAKINSFILTQNVIICFLCLADNQKNINIGMLFSQQRYRLIYFLPLIYGFLRFMLILFEIMVRKFIDISQLLKLAAVNVVFTILLFNSSLLLILSCNCLLLSFFFDWGHPGFRFKHKYPAKLFWITILIHCKYIANRYYFSFQDPMFLLTSFSIIALVWLQYCILKCVVGNRTDPHQIQLIPINSKVKQDNFQCSICLLPIKQQGQQRTMAKTPCKHIFHSHCLKEWLKFKNQCPIDRNYVYCPSWQDDYERDFVRRLIEVQPNIAAHIVRSLSQNSNSSEETEDQLQNQDPANASEQVQNN